MAEVNTLADALPAQIKRVQAKKERWLGYLHDHDMGPGTLFSTMIMQAEIDEAIAALASGDVVRMLDAHEALADYSDGD